MDAHELLNQRVRNFHDAVQMKKAPKRVPHISSFMTWKFVDAGVKFSDGMYDYDLCEKVHIEWEERYKFDVLREFGTRNPIKIIQGFAAPRYVINDENSTINALDFTLMEGDEYDELLTNKRKFLWERVVARRYPELQNATDDQIRSIIRGFQEYNEYNAKITKIYREQFGVPYFYGCPSFSPCAIESLMNNYRGIKGTSIDMRRHKDKIKALCDQHVANVVTPAVEKLKAGPKGELPEFAFDTSGASLCHTILSPKQWEEFYWPGMKMITDAIVETDKTSYWFYQGAMYQFADFFKDIEKGHICIHIELGDLFEIRKMLPNIALAGGMPMTRLYEGTPEECVDIAKKLVDGLGQEGGFILSQDKMCSYPKDCRRETLLAVCDFIQNYGE